MPDAGGIEAFVATYVALSSGHDLSAKRAMWDADETSPVLAPEEAASPLVGWPAMEGYWAATTALLEGLETRILEIKVVQVAGDLAFAVYAQRWRAAVPAAAALLPRPIASTVRVMMGLRLKPSGWRIFCLLEGHVDAAAYARALHRRAVASPAPDAKIDTGP